MVSTPPNDTDLIKRTAVEYVVLLGPNDGSKPTLDDRVDTLQLESIKRSRGSDRVDAIVCTYDLSKTGRLIDTTTPTGHNRILEVRAYDPEGYLTIVKAWGVVTQQSQAITENNEYVTLIARQEEWLFGEPIYHFKQWNTEDPIHADIVFQPIIDDVTENNRAEPTQASQSDPPVFSFIDPESVRTADAEAFQEATAVRWTLAEAVFYLFQHVGSNDYYEFPTIADLRETFDDDLKLSDIRIPMGTPLPEALDLLVNPYGYFWYVRSEINLLDETLHFIEFAKRGSGDTVSVYMNRPGETINNLLTNLDEYRATFNIGDLANRIIAVTSPIELEATFELYKGWSEDDDDLDLHQLEKGGDGSLFESKRDVGRKWMLNEARDHDSLRADIDGDGAQELAIQLGLDDSEVDNFKRRKFKECFSKNPDGESNGVVVEWLNEDLADDENPDGKWERVEWPFSVLEKECGIYFEGSTPPDGLWSLVNEDPTKARVRVTAVVEGDKRRVVEVDRTNTSPNAADLTLFMDLSAQYHWRVISLLGTIPESNQIQPSIMKDKLLHENNDTDDETDLQAFSEKVVAIEDVTLLSCSLTLEGVDHPEYELGKLIDQVNGRNLDLNAKNPDQSGKRLPQIIGINEFYNEEQRTELLLESFKEEQPKSEIK
ncbi:hypothetical protein [Gimesia fumaroli]|uniref:Uncharacterized protein n=1 Tax=Gimesia fumaroli TaxID=2527976 RepID=A0A518ICP6_9PLAN|nr:hypothetical protein [Gimesia fumaroli]QDV50864.1 hypothetical protein Enr17x_29090 [Gimesia fumaroli]